MKIIYKLLLDYEENKLIRIREEEILMLKKYFN